MPENEKPIAGTARSRLVDLGFEPLADNSLTAKRSDMRYIRAWARAAGASSELPMSVDDVALFLIQHLRDGLPSHVEEFLVSAGVRRPGVHAPTTVKRRLASLSVAHVEAGLPNPCLDPQIRLFLRRATRRITAEGWRPRQAPAAYGADLESILAACGGDLHGVRDKALILFGVFSGGRRRSEVSTANCERLVRVGADYEYRLGATKTSASADTGVIPIQGRCAIALDAWLSVSGISSGPLFRAIDRGGRVAKTGLSGRTVDRIVKKRARLAGLEDASFTSHSLRAGFMTEACRRGVPLVEAMALSFHATVEAAATYYRPGRGLKNLAASLSD